jgi:hypothetical protein
MPFLTSDAWYEVTFHPLGKTPWKLMPYAPSISTMMLDMLIKGVPQVMYVESSEQGQACGPGGQAIGLDDSLVAVATPLPSIALSSKGMVMMRMCKDKIGRLFWFDEGSTGLVLEYDAAQASALKSFL